MPTVQTYGPRKILPDALPSVRQTAAETPESEGAGLQQARARTWETIGQVGEGVAGKGTSLLAKQWDEERQRADETALLDAQNQLLAWEQKRLYDPANGALTVTGKDAMPLPETVGKEFNDVSGQIEAGLSTDRQREAFDKIKSEHGLNLDLTLRRHVFQQMQQYEQGELASFVENSTNHAAANALDPRVVADDLAKVADAIKTHAPRLGLGPEQQQKAIAAAQSGVHVNVIDRLLAVDKDQAAKAYFEEVKPQIAGDALARIEKALELGTIRGESQRRADAILIAGGTPDEQRTQVRAIADPELRDAVMERVEHDIAVTEKNKRDAEEAAMQQAYNIVDATGSFSAIPTDLMNSLPGPGRLALRSYAVDKARGIPTVTDSPTYYALVTQAGEDPAGFVKVNLLTKRDKLDDSDFKQLADLQLTIRNGQRREADVTLAGFRTRDEILKDTLGQYGIDPAAKPDTPAGKSIAELRRMLDLRVDSYESQSGKKATNTEIQQKLDALLAVQVKTPGGFFSHWPWSKAPLTGSKRAIDLTIADVPADLKKRIEDRRRARGLPVTDQTTLDTYVEMQAAQ